MKTKYKINDFFINQISMGNLTAVQVMIENPANLKNPDNINLGLIYAMDGLLDAKNEIEKSNYKEIIKLLLKNNANVNIQNEEIGINAIQMTALQYAAKKIGNADVVKQLLSHGADVNLKNKLGRTAL